MAKKSDKRRYAQMTQKAEEAFIYYLNMKKPSYERLAKELDIPHGTINRWSHIYDWGTLKTEYRKSLFQKRLEMLEDYVLSKQFENLERMQTKEEQIDLETIKVKDMFAYEKFNAARLNQIKAIKDIMSTVKFANDSMLVSLDELNNMGAEDRLKLLNNILLLQAIQNGELDEVYSQLTRGIKSEGDLMLKSDDKSNDEYDEELDFEIDTGEDE